MNKIIAIALAMMFVWVGLAAETVHAQAGGQERQAAAEAYDRGTAAYLARDYAKAAQWFETANRMAAAAAALIQAIRSHVHAGNEMRAATLAIQLSELYPNEPAAVQYAKEILDEQENKFLRIDILCSKCRVDLNGVLQEYLSFFAEPDTSHTLVAHFDSGDVEEEVEGEAGESREITFEPPSGSSQDGVPIGPTGGDGTIIDPSNGKDGLVDDKKPLSPIFTYIGAGLTVALGVGTIIAAVDMYSGKDAYEEKAKEWREADSSDKEELFKEADKLLDEGRTKEVITSVLLASTAAFAVGTGVIALFFTQWSEDKSDEPELSTTVAPTSDGAYISLKARF